VGVYHRMGDEVKGVDRTRPGRIAPGGHTAKDIPEAQEAMGIDWMPLWPELKEAIPPAYTEHLGRQMLAYLDRRPRRG
jgi:hypothetical protein